MDQPYRCLVSEVFFLKYTRTHRVAWPAQKDFQSNNVLASFLTDVSSKFSRAEGSVVLKTKYASVGFHLPKEISVWFFVSSGHTVKFSNIDVQLEVHWVNVKAGNCKMPLDITTNISAVWWQNSVMALMNFTGDVFLQSRQVSQTFKGWAQPL